MKRNNGFTLLELLAVIVVLALISFIAIPGIFKIIEKSKMGAAKASALKYIKEINQLGVEYSDELVYGNIEEVTESEWLEKLDLSGTLPSSGSVTIDESGLVTWASLCINKYNVVYENNVAKVTGKCMSKRGEFDIVDATPGDLACENVEDEKTCYIESIEDLVAFSDMVNGNNGKDADDFEGVHVILKHSLDFNNDFSYSDPNTKWGYDINGNGEIESLKDELTKDGGFYPIGLASNTPFKGTFDGNGYTINNLLINRKDTNYVAMFGYNEGVIRGLNIKNINVTGNKYVAGIAASNKGIVSMINLEGNINGVYAGGIVSEGNYASSTVKDVIMNGTVTGTSSAALAYYSYGLYGIVESGTYSSVYGSGNYRKVAYVTGKVSSKSTTYAYVMNENTYNNISAYNDYVQTILDGANDDGYYFDYNKDGSDIVVKHISTSPINSSLKGNGTIDSPYLIYTIDDMRKLSFEETSEKYYSLQNNLDYTGKEYYVIGTSTKPFKGTFDGNGYTISNITINGNDYVAMFGYNEGVIRGLNIKNINVTGNKYVAGIAASNKGIVSMINLEGNINGASAGGIVSEGNYASSTVKDVIMNGTVTGTSSAALAY